MPLIVKVCDATLVFIKLPDRVKFEYVVIATAPVNVDDNKV